MDYSEVTDEEMFEYLNKFKEGMEEANTEQTEGIPTNTEAIVASSLQVRNE